MPSLSQRLGKFTLEKLKIICKDCGVVVSGTTKSYYVNAITSHIRYAAAKRSIPLTQFPQSDEEESTATILYPPFKSVISIDIGLSNLAYAHLSQDGDLLAWESQIVQFSKCHYLPDYVPTIQEFVQQIRCTIRNEGSDPADVGFLLERQAQITTSEFMFQSIFRSLVVEAMLHSQLYPSAVSVTPKKVQSFFELPTGKDKRKASVALISAWMAGQQGNCDRQVTLPRISQAHRIMFQQTKKKNELTDCLAQAVAYFEWQKNLTRLMQFVNANPE
jgi:hypothetical protein